MRDILEGYYWVECGHTEPEVWFFHEGIPRGWFAPAKEKPIAHSKFLELGYRVISAPLMFG